MKNQNAQPPKSTTTQLVELLATPAIECGTAFELSEYLELVGQVSDMLARGLRQATRGGLYGGEDSGLKVEEMSDHLAKEVRRTRTDAHELLILAKHVIDLTASVGDAALLASVKFEQHADVAVRYAVAQIEKQPEK